jgi:hypothetical protein
MKPTKPYSSREEKFLQTVVFSQEGPATHLCLVLFVCRSYETKPHFAGPPRFRGLFSTCNELKRQFERPTKPWVLGVLQVTFPPRTCTIPIAPFFVTPKFRTAHLCVVQLYLVLYYWNIRSTVAAAILASSRHDRPVTSQGWQGVAFARSEFWV